MCLEIHTHHSKQILKILLRIRKFISKFSINQTFIFTSQLKNKPGCYVITSIANASRPRNGRKAIKKTEVLITINIIFIRTKPG
jgi:hypothetical protein